MIIIQEMRHAHLIASKVPHCLNLSLSLVFFKYFVRFDIVGLLNGGLPGITRSLIEKNFFLVKQNLDIIRTTKKYVKPCIKLCMENKQDTKYSHGDDINESDAMLQL